MNETQICRNIVQKINQMEISQEENPSFLMSSMIQSTPSWKMSILELETTLIMPTENSLKSVIDAYRQNLFLGFNAKTLDQFVSLTRFQNGLDKVYCDWCGIINGFNEMILYSIKYYISNKKDIMNLLNNLHIPDNCIYFISNVSGYSSCLKSFDKEIKNELNLIKQMVYKNYNLKLEELKFKKIKLFLEWLYCVEYIEQRWCPFTHMRNVNYDRDYYYYNSHNDYNLKLASDILKREGKITCNNCIRTLNKQTKLRTQEESIFKEYINYIKKI